MRIRLLGLILVAGCTTTIAPRTTIATVQDEVRVCRPQTAFHVGQPLRFVRPQCKPLNAKSSVVHCTPEPIAEGEVVRLEGECAGVRVSHGETPRDGDGVEVAVR